MTELDLEERLYTQLWDYDQAVQNAENRFHDSEEARRVIFGPDGQVRCWVHVYISAIDIFGTAPFEFQEPSIQLEILKRCGECGRPDLPTLFEGARDSSWKAAVNIAERDLIYPKEPSCFSFPEKRQAIITSPIILRRPPAVASEAGFQTILREVRSGNFEFLRQIADRDQRQFHEVSQVKYAVLKLWVNPNFPLWLMTARAASEVVSAFCKRWNLTVREVSQKSFEVTKARLRDDEGLITNPKPVIVDLRPKGQEPRTN